MRLEEKVHTKQSNLKSMIEVKHSSIHGKGVFAACTISKGSWVGTYEGTPTNEIDTYVLWVYDEDTGEETGIDGENDLKYLNHSTQPNCEFDGFELYALRNLHLGEELTFDYGESPV